MFYKYVNILLYVNEKATQRHQHVCPLFKKTTCNYLLFLEVYSGMFQISLMSIFCPRMYIEQHKQRATFYIIFFLVSSQLSCKNLLFIFQIIQIHIEGKGGSSVYFC